MALFKLILGPQILKILKDGGHANEPIALARGE